MAKNTPLDRSKAVKSVLANLPTTIKGLERSFLRRGVKGRRYGIHSDVLVNLLSMKTGIPRRAITNRVSVVEVQLGGGRKDLISVPLIVARFIRSFDDNHHPKLVGSMPATAFKAKK